MIPDDGEDVRSPEKHDLESLGLRLLGQTLLRSRALNLVSRAIHAPVPWRPGAPIAPSIAHPGAVSGIRHKTMITHKATQAIIAPGAAGHSVLLTNR